MTSRGAQSFRIRIIGLLILLGGILAGQYVCYGPSLAGDKLLLPLDILAMDSVYLPGKPVIPHDRFQVDLIEQWEPARQFGISELHSGRLPMWNPYQFAGCPVIWPKFSPFLLAQCCAVSPVILAWAQLLAAVVGGLGMFAFLRRALQVSYWAAAIPAWCYPVTVFFVFWQGAIVSYPPYWLPWLLLAVDRTARGASKAAPIGVGILTGLVLVSGSLDVAGQVLLVSGLYGLWCLWDEHSNKKRGEPLRP